MAPNIQRNNFGTILLDVQENLRLTQKHNYIP
jgi:hypothetical protein